jgi:hypothetical protein
MPNILHLSDTPLSGSPIRITQLTNKYSEKYRARHIVFNKRVRNRLFDVDIAGAEITKEEFIDRINWADVIHYHNRWKRQEIFARFGMTPPDKPSVIQMHSPRDSEDFREELDSKVPLAIVAQYQPREWPELNYIVPNVVDIWDERMLPRKGFDGLPYFSSRELPRKTPIISYTPSNVTAKNWDDKGYNLVMPILQNLKKEGKVILQVVTDKPHAEALLLKKSGDVGIDEIATGSYHLSGLEYVAMGIPCICNLDGYTLKTLRDVSGSDTTPFSLANRDNFNGVIRSLLTSNEHIYAGQKARMWMEKYWNPAALLKHYEEMYQDL